MPLDDETWCIIYLLIQNIVPHLINPEAERPIKLVNQLLDYFLVIDVVLLHFYLTAASWWVMNDLMDAFKYLVSLFFLKCFCWNSFKVWRQVGDFSRAAGCLPPPGPRRRQLRTAELFWWPGARGGRRWGGRRWGRWGGRRRQLWKVEWRYTQHF